MSLDYTTLQTLVLSQSKRSDKATQCPQYIRSCESMIKRKVLALESRVTLDESDRASEGIYNLPSNVQEVRAVYGSVASQRVLLRNVGLMGLTSLAESDDSLYYAIVGTTIEFRGVPGAGSEFEIVMLGWPEALATTPSNDLLTNFEDLYVFGTLFYLYNDTQDLELAQACLSVFEDVARHLNKQTKQRLGSPSPQPLYNFGHIATGRGY